MKLKYILQVLLDELVLPAEPIVNYNTAFSGELSCLLLPISCAPKTAQLDAER